MPKVFHPISRFVVFVDASCGPYYHPEGTKYRIAIGNEVWDNANPLVLKIQMVYENTGVQGRRSPSFPLGTKDFERVTTKANELLARAEEEGLKGIIG